jgi:hypothetical protein
MTLCQSPQQEVHSLNMWHKKHGFKMYLTVSAETLYNRRTCWKKLMEMAFHYGGIYFDCVIVYSFESLIKLYSILMLIDVLLLQMVPGTKR